MQKLNFEELVERIVAKDPRYHGDAYDFLRAALDFTQGRVARGAEREKAKESKEKARSKVAEAVDPQRHVTGQQLLEGIREFALREFGPMALDLFREWGITRCEDFGEMVFNLVDHQVLRKTSQDSREDFKGGYDFEAAFRHPFLPPSRLPRSSTEPTATER